MFLLILSGIFLGLVACLDLGFRLRMARIGHKFGFLKGGTFDYRAYQTVRRERGWATWPLYLMAIALICGLSLLIAGAIRISVRALGPPTNQTVGR